MHVMLSGLGFTAQCSMPCTNVHTATHTMHKTSRVGIQRRCSMPCTNVHTATHMIVYMQHNALFSALKRTAPIPCPMHCALDN